MNIKWISEQFKFSSNERRGIIFLLFIIFILIVIGKLLPLLIPKETVDYSKFEAEVNSYLESTKNTISDDLTYHPVAFNPNEVDSVSLVNMGVPTRVVANWIKYLEKGGRFKDNAGVKKIFGMTPELFDQLDSFMVIHPMNFAKDKVASRLSIVELSNEIKHDTNSRRTFAEREKKPQLILELNSTDSIQLIEIRGIGPVFASRIIRYRNLLGGYYAVAQLKEVYGMREENFVAISSFLTVDQSTLKSFNINFSTIHELGRHPYVGFRTAQKILKLRDKMGRFSSLDDLATVVSADSLKRLLPYIKFYQ